MKTKFLLLLASLTLFLTACEKNIEKPLVENENENDDSPCYAIYDMLVGTYTSDINDCKIVIYATEDGFATSGLCGDGLWFPNAPLSGKLDSCSITLDKYTDVRRRFESGDDETYYFESMSGIGNFHPKNDSLTLYLSYRRVGALEGEFSGFIHLKKDTN